MIDRELSEDEATLILRWRQFWQACFTCCLLLVLGGSKPEPESPMDRVEDA